MSANIVRLLKNLTRMIEGNKLMRTWRKHHRYSAYFFWYNKWDFQDRLGRGLAGAVCTSDEVCSDHQCLHFGWLLRMSYKCWSRCQVAAAVDIRKPKCRCRRSSFFIRMIRTLTIVFRYTITCTGLAHVIFIVQLAWALRGAEYLRTWESRRQAVSTNWMPWDFGTDKDHDLKKSIVRI